MTKNSHRGYLEHINTSTPVDLYFDEPVSAYTAWVIRNNTQHLLDQSGQYRVNWVADTSKVGTLSVNDPTGTNDTRKWVFPITSIRPDRPMNLDIRVATVFSGTVTSALIDAELSPEGKPSQVMWSTSQSTSTSTAVWVVDELCVFTSEQRHKVTRGEAPSGDAGGSSTAATSFLDQLELRVKLTGTFGGSGTIYVIGCQVREYP